MTPTGMRLVMLIDDEPAQQRLVSALAARAGWRTIFAADSETAIAMLGTRDGMMLDAGCWMLDAGCWMLDAGCCAAGSCDVG
jgi:CheY-like chemotaxis protein